MKKQTGDTYQGGLYAKALVVAESKAGKTCSLVGGALGVLPWQTEGAIVSEPKNLHILTFDSDALGNIKLFLTKTCAAPKEALGFTVYNLEDDLKKAFSVESSYDFTLYNGVFQALEEVRLATQRGGVHALIISSLTGLAVGVKRGISGEPKGKSSMDQNKWSLFGSQLNELQNWCQQDGWHTIWEGHLAKKMTGDRDASGEQTMKDSIQVDGSVGKSWAFNVSQVFRLRRQFRQPHPGTKCDLTYLDPHNVGDFTLGGRGFTEALEAKEPCVTSAFEKLGLKVGKWGAKSARPKAVAVQSAVKQQHGAVSAVRSNTNQQPNGAKR